ncbi:MAG TPA: hypothetical protein PKC18_09660 [Lacipirellulaceae bacterium]|nr:hypothetical protein [Lacipirellulaceae bacterium]
MKPRRQPSPPVSAPPPIRPRYALFFIMLGIYVVIMGLLVWMRAIR